MKKIIKTIIVIVILASLISLIQIKSSYAKTVGTTTVKALNFREEPSESADIIRSLKQGTEVEILGSSGNWYRVSYDGIEGYLIKDYVKTSSSSSENKTTEENTEKEESVENKVEENKTEETSENTTKEETEENKVEENVIEETEEEEEVSNQPAISEDTTIINQNGILINESEVYLLPLINSTKIGTLKTADTAKIVTTTGSWAYVSGDEIDGWVFIKNLTKLESSTEVKKSDESIETTSKEEEQESDSESTTMKVKASSVNIRSKASTSSSVISTITKGTEVEVTGTSGDWSIVEYKGKTGYIKSEYLTE